MRHSSLLFVSVWLVYVQVQAVVHLLCLCLMLAMYRPATFQKLFYERSVLDSASSGAAPVLTLLISEAAWSLAGDVQQHQPWWTPSCMLFLSLSTFQEVQLGG